MSSLVECLGFGEYVGSGFGADYRKRVDEVMPEDVLTFAF